MCPPATAPSRNRVVPTRVPGVAAQQPACAQGQPAQRSVAGHRFCGVFGTGREEAAGRGQQVAKCVPVPAQKQQQPSSGKSAFLTTHRHCRSPGGSCRSPGGSCRSPGGSCRSGGAVRNADWGSRWDHGAPMALAFSSSRASSRCSSWKLALASAGFPTITRSTAGISGARRTTSLIRRLHRLRTTAPPTRRLKVIPSLAGPCSRRRASSTKSGECHRWADSKTPSNSRLFLSAWSGRRRPGAASIRRRACGPCGGGGSGSAARSGSASAPETRGSACGGDCWAEKSSSSCFLNVPCGLARRRKTGEPTYYSPSRSRSRLSPQLGEKSRL